MKIRWLIRDLVQASVMAIVATVIIFAVFSLVAGELGVVNLALSAAMVFGIVLALWPYNLGDDEEDRKAAVLLGAWISLAVGYAALFLSWHLIDEQQMLRGKVVLGFAFLMSVRTLSDMAGYSRAYEERGQGFEGLDAAIMMWIWSWAAGPLGRLWSWWEARRPRVRGPKLVVKLPLKWSRRVTIERILLTRLLRKSRRWREWSSELAFHGDRVGIVVGTVWLLFGLWILISSDPLKRGSVLPGDYILMYATFLTAPLFAAHAFTVKKRWFFYLGSLAALGLVVSWIILASLDLPLHLIAYAAVAVVEVLTNVVNWFVLWMEKPFFGRRGKYWLLVQMGKVPPWK